MVFEGIHLRGNEGVLEMSFDGRTWGAWRGCNMIDCRVGISFNNR